MNGNARDPALRLKDCRVTVAGLGLIGGSIAKALMPQGPAALWAIDRDPAVLERAKREGVISEGFTDAREPLPYSDLVIVCLYPGDAIEFINSNRAYFKPGSVVTDVCGVKTPLAEGVRPLGDIRSDFVPGHPMAGRERTGYGESTASLFMGCNYILTPLPGNRPGSVENVRGLALALGAARVIETDCRIHDEYVAFTSHLPHALSVAYMRASGERDVAGFAGGSFQDMSRVALINDAMWSELFILNRDKLAAEIGGLCRRLEELSRMIAAGNTDDLRAALRGARRIKEAYDAASHR